MTDITTDLAALGLKARPEQILMSEWMTQDAAQGGISLVEAAPATGKTIAMLHHAIRLAAETGERVLVAVPTLAVMRQVMDTGHRLLSAMDTSVGMAAIYGRQEYVSPDATEAWITSQRPEALTAFQAWRASQNDQGWTRSSLDEMLRLAGYEIDLPPETTLLARRHPEAEASYRLQYETQAQVLVCTHVLLGRDVASRVGRRGDDETSLSAMEQANERRLRDEMADDRLLPEWRHLVVDEAHQLVAGFMMALTSRLSFRRLLDILKARMECGVHIPPKPLGNLRRSIEALERENGSKARRLSLDDRLDRMLVRSVEQCIPEQVSWLGGTEDEQNYLRRFRDAAMLSQRNRTRIAPRITWSDVNHVLGLSVIPVSFGRHMDFCFRACRSAALLSATLYTHDDEPHEHLARQLMLPADRIVAQPPIGSEWLTRGVTLHLPEGEMADDLNPTRREWTSALAETITLAAEDSVSGMLVLATSYQSIDEMVDLLDDRADRLLTTDERGVGPTAQRFVEAARAGRRPIWLATGPAWTGLDLPGDTIDTLLVTRLPFGLSNPVMHEHYMGSVQTRVGYRDAENDMLRTLKQGIGRLVRDRGDRTRMLWVADGRIAGHVAGLRARDMLSIYEDQVEFGR